MPAAVVTLQSSPLTNGFVKGTYVCDATPAITYVIIGFVPSVVQAWNATDGDQVYTWSTGLGAGKAINTTTAAALVSSGAITAYSATAASGAAPAGAGFSVGTDASVQEASDTFEFIAWR
jgi:hypothetical protein